MGIAMTCADFSMLCGVYETKGYFTHQKNVSFATARYIKVCGKFYTSHRLTVTSCHHRNLTSAGLPAGRAFCTEVSLSPLSVIAPRK